MSFIVTPNPDVMFANMGKVAEYETAEEAMTAINKSLSTMPNRVLTLAEKIGSYTGTVAVSEVKAPVAPETAASSDPVAAPTDSKS